MMPSSPMLGRRSGTNSPKMDRLDFVKDSVIGELATRIGKPIPEFNKNKRGSSGDCELHIVQNSPTISRNVPEYAAKDYINFDQNLQETDQQRLSRAVVSAQLKPLLQPQSASAPCSPRLGLRRPQQQITITSSASLKVTNNQNSRAGTPTSNRERSNSPAVNRLAAPSNARSSSSNPSRTSSSAARRSRPSPSPTRRSRPTTQATIPVGGHTSVKMSTKKKSPARTVPNLNRSISANPRSKTAYNRSTSQPATNGKKTNGSTTIDLNDPAIQAKIGNRATKTVEKTIGKCGMCMKPITADGCTAFGKVYHKECFKCCVCKRRIDGKFFQKNGKPYCEKDYAKIVEECCVCKQPIKGDCIESGTKAYHPGCLKCFVCQEVLRGQYFFYEGEPICEKDYKRRADKCSECSEPIIGMVYTLDGKNFCEEHYMGKCDACPKCNEPITGHMVRTESAAFHSKCFTCCACNKDLSHDQFILDENKNIYCTDDWAKKKAYRCVTCKRPIVAAEGQTKAPRLRALGKDYHPDCFKCEDCGLLLDTRKKGQECYPHKNHIYCLKCNRKKFSSDEESSDNDEN